MLFASACFGEYAPSQEASQSTAVATTTTTTTAVATTTTTGGTSVGSSTASTSSSSGEPLLCEHLNILILTDVSVSMLPFANGIANILIALGGQIGETLDDVGTYRLALAFNAPPLVNEGAFSLPGGGAGCTQVGALVRGQDDCVLDFDERPYLTEEDDLGAGLTCLSTGVTAAGFNLAYERPRIFDTLLAILGAHDDAALAICNEGFHESPDPLVVILIADADDESDGTVLEAVSGAIGTQPGSSLKNIGLFVIGEDASECPMDAGEDCVAEPACRVQDFIDRGFNNAGVGDNVRRFNICLSLNDETADVAASLLTQLTAVLDQVCGS